MYFIYNINHILKDVDITSSVCNKRGIEIVIHDLNGLVMMVLRIVVGPNTTS